ncbi:MAG TPA: hypothetical protein VGG16_00890 [Streptosporangiaceae bacterium]
MEVRSGDVYYTLAEVAEAWIIGGVLEQVWWNRDHRARTLTGVRHASDGLDFEVDDGGRRAVMHESETSVLGALRVSGARIVGAELRDGNVYFALQESSVTARAS